MENNWKVNINNEGHLFVQAASNTDNFENLFGLTQMQIGLCIYAHDLGDLRQMLQSLFPHAGLNSLQAIEEIIRFEFCESRSLNEFRHVLESRRIPFRSFSSAA